MHAMLLCARLMVLGQLLLPGMAPMTAGGAPAVAPSASQAASSRTMGDPTASLTIVRLFKGEQKLTAGDLANPQFWLTLVKEPALALVQSLPRVLAAAIFFALFWGTYRVIRRILHLSMGRAGVDASIRDMLTHGIQIIVMGAGIIMALNQLGIQIAPLLAGASIAGLAIGLAAQETLANFIAGMVIFWDKPFRVGDCIDIESACGTIQRVTFRSTRLLTFDGEIVVLPNTMVLAKALTNYSAHSSGRVNISVGISYNASIDAARRALLDLVANDDRVADRPEPAVIVSDLADSSVRLNFWFWTRDKSGVARLKFEYMEKVKEALDAAGIEIPFPHMNIMLHSKSRQEAGENVPELRVAG